MYSSFLYDVGWFLETSRSSGVSGLQVKPTSITYRRSLGRSPPQRGPRCATITKGGSVVVSCIDPKVPTCISGPLALVRLRVSMLELRRRLRQDSVPEAKQRHLSWVCPASWEKGCRCFVSIRGDRSEAILLVHDWM
jgi:hypothetical protein